MEEVGFEAEAGLSCRENVGLAVIDWMEYDRMTAVELFFPEE